MNPAVEDRASSIARRLLVEGISFSVRTVVLDVGRGNIRKEPDAYLFEIPKTITDLDPARGGIYFVGEIGHEFPSRVLAVLLELFPAGGIDDGTFRGVVGAPDF